MQRCFRCSGEKVTDATGQNTCVDHLVCVVEVDSRGRVIQLKKNDPGRLLSVTGANHSSLGLSLTVYHYSRLWFGWIN